MRYVNKICNVEKLCAEPMVNSRILRYFVTEFVIFAIYSIFLHGWFCYNLRAFAWRKIAPEIVPVEKKGQISGCAGTRFAISFYLHSSTFALTYHHN